MTWLCKLGLHKWRPFGVDGLVLPTFIDQCQRCKCGRGVTFTGTFLYTKEQMEEAARRGGSDHIDPESRNFKEGIAVGLSCEQRLANLIRNPVCDRCGARNAEEASTMCSPDGDSCPGTEFPLTNLWGDA